MDSEVITDQIGDRAIRDDFTVSIASNNQVERVTVEMGVTIDVLGKAK
jgi:hypothetical protein